MAKLTKKMLVKLGGVSIGGKDTNRVACAVKFGDVTFDANEAVALLAGGVLHCRFDKAPGLAKLPLDPKTVPPTVVEFDGHCGRISMDAATLAFGISFPKSGATGDVLAEFAGSDAKLTVTRLGDVDGPGDETDAGATE